MQKEITAKEAKHLIEELFEFDRKEDLYKYLNDRRRAFEGTDFFWNRLYDHIGRTTVLDEGTKIRLLDHTYQDEEWKGGAFYGEDDIYLFLQDLFRRKKIEEYHTYRNKYDPKINGLCKIAGRYFNSLQLKDDEKGSVYAKQIRVLKDKALMSIDNYLFDIDKDYIDKGYKEINYSFPLDTLIHIYFAKDIGEALNKVGSVIDQYAELIKDEALGHREDYFMLKEGQSLDAPELYTQRTIYNQAFKRTYAKYTAVLSANVRDFKSYKKWELARWNKVLAYYNESDWGYIVIRKYINQISRYKEQDIQRKRSVQEYSFGIDKKHKAQIVKFFNAFETQDEWPLLHRESKSEDIADLLTAADYRKCKKVYFLCKGRVVTYVLQELYNRFKDDDTTISLNAAAEDCKKIMYRGNIILFEHAKDIPLEEYRSMKRTAMNEGQKSYRVLIKTRHKHEFAINEVIKKALDQIEV